MNLDFLENSYEGFDSASYEDIQTLNKAFEANDSETDISKLTGFGALTPQSLERSLSKLVPKMTDCTLYQDIPKSGANSLIEEYSRQLGYGSGEGGWVGQMENGPEDDPYYERDFAIVKFMRQQWKFGDVTGLIKNPIQTSEVAQKQSAMMRCVRETNRALYSGDSELNSHAIDGFEKAIRQNGSPDHIIDLRGEVPNQGNFRHGAELIHSNQGQVEGIGVYLSPGAQTTLDNSMELVGGRGGQRFFPNKDNNGMLDMGFGVSGIKTSFGRMVPRIDRFIASEYESRTVPHVYNRELRKMLEAATNIKAPAMPTFTLETVTNQAGSKWSSLGVRKAGVNYGYRVAAGNQYGYSQACAEKRISTPVESGGGNKLSINSGGGVYPATFFEVYSEKNAGTGIYRFVCRVKSTGGVTEYTDLNKTIPGTSKMFMMDLSSIGEDRTFTLARLAPIHSIEFSKIGNYRWGTVNLYVAPKYYKPNVYVMFENVPIDVESMSPYLNL